MGMYSPQGTLYCTFCLFSWATFSKNLLSFVDVLKFVNFQLFPAAYPECFIVGIMFFIPRISTCFLTSCLVLFSLLTVSFDVSFLLSLEPLFHSFPQSIGWSCFFFLSIFESSHFSLGDCRFYSQQLASSHSGRGSIWSQAGYVGRVWHGGTWLLIPPRDPVNRASSASTHFVCLLYERFHFRK